MFTPLAQLDVKPWTHWCNKKQARLFLVVDIPLTEDDFVVLMEVKDYTPDEERIFVKILYMQFLKMREKNQLTAYVPQV
jgi:hypothetical protein